MKAISGFSIIITAAALSVLWLDSCCRHHKEKETAIDFGLSAKGTKAVVDNKDSLISLCFADPQNTVGFGVYGYKTISNNPFRSFDNIEVIPDNRSNSTTWSYSPLRYWDSNSEASYQFIAYWPHVGTTSGTLGNGAYVSEASKVLTIHNIPYWQDATQSSCADYMTAERVGNYSKGDFTDEQTGEVKVRFTFKHVLAKLIIRAYYVGIKKNPVRISGLSLSGSTVLSTDGKAAYSQPFGQLNITPTFSGIETSNTTHTLYSAAQGQYTELPQTTWDDEDDDPNDHGYKEICSWLMVPSSGWDDLELNIAYSIGAAGNGTANSAHIEDFSLSSVVNNVPQTGQTLSANSYLVTLLFNSAGGDVTMQSVLVKDWVPDTITTGVYNW